MTKQEILTRLEGFLEETDNMEEFKKAWDITNDEASFILALSMARALIRYILENK